MSRHRENRAGRSLPRYIARSGTHLCVTLNSCFYACSRKQIEIDRRPSGVSARLIAVAAAPPSAALTKERCIARARLSGKLALISRSFVQFSGAGVVEIPIDFLSTASSVILLRNKLRKVVRTRELRILAYYELLEGSCE